MANYVSNTVRFLGEPDKLAEVRQLFMDIEEKQARTNRYHLPDFVKGGNGHMLDIVPDGDWLNYETRWQPNLDLLQQIAGHYRLDFIAHYEEPTNFMYGEAVFTNNELHQVTVSSFDGEDWYNDPEFLAIQDLQALLLSPQQIKR